MNDAESGWVFYVHFSWCGLWCGLSYEGLWNFCLVGYFHGVVASVSPCNSRPCGFSCFISVQTVWFYGMVMWCVVHARVHILFENLKSHLHVLGQQGDVKQVSQFSSDLWTSLLSCFLLDACELITFLYVRKDCNNYTDIIRHHCTRFQFLGD